MKFEKQQLNTVSQNVNSGSTLIVYVRWLLSETRLKRILRFRKQPLIGALIQCTVTSI